MFDRIRSKILVGWIMRVELIIIECVLIAVFEFDV